MQRAVKIFPLEVRESDSAFVAKVWRSCSVPEPAFISIAASHWEMVVTRQAGGMQLTVRGPETRAMAMPIPDDAEFFGIEFRLGTFMPGLPVDGLVDRGLNLTAGPGRSFRLDGSAWDFPDYDNADTFVNRLVRKGLLVRDPVVVAALDERPLALSPRSVERRVKRVTGLTRGAIRQIQRATRAAAMLDEGASILDTVTLTGFADQPHLTRSLKRFIGQTPGQIAGEAL